MICFKLKMLILFVVTIIRRNMYDIRIFSIHPAHHTCTEKVHPSEDVNTLRLISDFCQKNVLLPYFS